MIGNFENRIELPHIDENQDVYNRNWESERPENISKQPENSDFSPSLFSDIKCSDSERPKEEGPAVKNKTIGMIPRNGGNWTDEPGNSNWKPDPDIQPGNRNGTNPGNKTWDELMEEYNFEFIPFKDGEPDFSDVSKGVVKIDDFTDDRSSNFDQADEKLAEQKGCTPEEVSKWRKENKYTWHECRDCKTMHKVPTEVHGNISHSGGVSEYKSKNS